MTSQSSRGDERYLACEQAVNDLPKFNRRAAAKSEKRETLFFLYSITELDRWRKQAATHL
jgi:hypothetical protein